jgi:hypothetical protein
MVTQMVVFIIAAAVIGAVVFGGTTWVYFRGKHAPDSPRGESPQRLHDPAPVPAYVEESAPRHDRAA